MSVDAVSALERGTRRRPRFDTVALLAAALKLDDEQRRTFESVARPPLPSVAVGPEPQPLPAPATNLPASPSRLVGRETELETILDLVRSKRLVTLAGTGGIGKTRTAVEAAAVVAGRDGVWLVELAPASDAAAVAAAVASTLGVRARPDHPLLDIIIAFLKTKNVLLLLDNCEHVVEEAARIADVLLRGCPTLRILATCREPLHIAGEYSYRLASLDAPSAEDALTLSPHEAQRFAAVALFTERAQQADHRFALSAQNVPVVAEICRRLDGIPLALELAAARVSILPVKALWERLDQRFALLTGGSRAALPRQQTLHALVEWSYTLF